MTKEFLTIFTAAVLAIAVSTCGSDGANKTTTSETKQKSKTEMDKTTRKSKPDSNEKNMTMTTTNDELRFSLGGSGTATVAWGNEKKTVKLAGNQYKSFVIDFSNATSRTVTISGKKITYFDCVWGGLTKLDVSKNTALTELILNVNQLKSLDLSKNTALTYLDLKANQFTATALNNLFGTLHGKGGTINIAYNPGTDNCNKRIAEAKKWTVEIVEQENYD